MICSMPNTLGNEIVVSADEEAYLKASFRRFALPYMFALVAVFAIAALWLVGRVDPPQVDVQPVVSQAMIDEVRAESLALRAQLSRVLERVNAVGEELSGASRRVEELERRVEKVTGRGGVGRGELVSLARRLDETDRRITALESSRAELEARASRLIAPPAHQSAPAATTEPPPS